MTLRNEGGSPYIDPSQRMEYRICVEYCGAIVYFTLTRLDRNSTERELANAIIEARDEIKQLSGQVEQNQGRIRTLERCIEIAPT